MGSVRDPAAVGKLAHRVRFALIAVAKKATTDGTALISASFKRENTGSLD